jgi:glutamine amidotransferase
MGNVGSIMNMIKKVEGRAVLSDDLNEISGASKLILPGVGNFNMGMQVLKDRGLDTALNQARDNGAAILGICLGMQLMTRDSEESERPGLGWFDYPTRKFPKETSIGDRLLVPHMGWNLVTTEASHPTTPGYVEGGRYYFVHSYYVDAAGEEDCLATTTYGGVKFASCIGRDNVQGVQFHPEKSHKFGMTLFAGFINC